MMTMKMRLSVYMGGPFVCDDILFHMLDDLLLAQ